MCEIYVKVAGNWEQVTTVSVKISGVWTTITEGWHRVDGAWRIFWQPGGFSPFTQTFYEPNRTPKEFGIFGTFYVPCGATSMTLRAWGGGGSGGAKFATEGGTSVAGSGGGGQYNEQGPYAVTSSDFFDFYIGGQTAPGSNSDPNPYNYVELFDQNGELGDQANVSNLPAPDFFFFASGGEGGFISVDGPGGGVIDDPTNPNNGFPSAVQPASGSGGNAGGVGGGLGGQVNPYVAPTFPGGGGPGGFNGSDGHFGVTPVLYVDWS